ncbi:uncharacterized protein LOC120356252 [Nilaparvata lugens]|uniref:uncharacterized protein LOC120356252 n=1 Tax=Nilaparvata lugens TaxID=108931 RepID=UPI00193DAF2B|nr:uncharacterized protein LOC120356252 [Nilaparvata lugens]
MNNGYMTECFYRETLYMGGWGSCPSFLRSLYRRKGGTKPPSTESNMSIPSMEAIIDIPTGWCGWMVHTATPGWGARPAPRFQRPPQVRKKEPSSHHTTALRSTSTHTGGTRKIGQRCGCQGAWSRCAVRGSRRLST